MIDYGDLAVQVVQSIASPAINKGGKSLIDWIKRRFKSHMQVIDGVDKLASDPESVAKRKILEGHLHEALEQSPPLAAELRDLLDHDVRHAKQSARASDGGTIQQIQGNNNRL